MSQGADKSAEMRWVLEGAPGREKRQRLWLPIQQWGKSAGTPPLLGTTWGDTLTPFWLPRHCYLQARTA